MLVSIDREMNPKSSQLLCFASSVNTAANISYFMSVNSYEAGNSHTNVAIMAGV
jgi:hypothetical protein